MKASDLKVADSVPTGNEEHLADSVTKEALIKELDRYKKLCKIQHRFGTEGNAEALLSALRDCLSSNGGRGLSNEKFDEYQRLCGLKESAKAGDTRPTDVPYEGDCVT